MLYEAFYDYLRGEAARSAHTVTAYRHDVESLRGFLKGESDAERDPRRITLAELRMWVAELASRGLSTVGTGFLPFSCTAPRNGVEPCFPPCDAALAQGTARVCEAGGNYG